MNPHTGEILHLTDEQRKEMEKQLGFGLIGVEEGEMTDKQKKEMQVSKHDNMSILGKKAVKARRGSNYTPPKKKRRKRK